MKKRFIKILIDENYSFIKIKRITRINILSAHCAEAEKISYKCGVFYKNSAGSATEIIGIITEKELNNL